MLLQYCCRRLVTRKAKIESMNDVEYIGRASTQRMTSIEQDNKAAQARYRQDILTKVVRRVTSKKPVTAELTRERFPEEN